MLSDKVTAVRSVIKKCIPGDNTMYIPMVCLWLNSASGETWTTRNRILKPNNKIQNVIYAVSCKIFLKTLWVLLPQNI